MIMLCPDCNTLNDSDARFCSECGKSIISEPKASSVKTSRAYLFALLLVPVIAIAGGLGYYKFFLPEGVAAVVNGEEIKRSALDSAVALMEASSGRANSDSERTEDRRLRYHALNELIMERLVMQEARKAGIEISDGEVATASAHAQTPSGLDKTGFDSAITRQYGSRRSFEEDLRRKLVINKFIAEKVAAQGSDSQRAGAAMASWLQDLSARATVRIALAEQWSGAGCGCGGPEARTPGGQAMNRGCAMSKAGSPAGQAGRMRSKRGASAQPNAQKAAADAGLRYWHEKHGKATVTTKLTDFGCHIQVDIVKNEKIIGSLRYQDGSITEL
jgi:hypothetical protein